jgi:hypothetical protein
VSTAHNTVFESMALGKDKLFFYICPSATAQTRPRCGA